MARKCDNWQHFDTPCYHFLNSKQVSCDGNASAEFCATVSHALYFIADFLLAATLKYEDTFAKRESQKHKIKLQKNQTTNSFEILAPNAVASHF